MPIVEIGVTIRHQPAVSRLAEPINISLTEYWKIKLGRKNDLRQAANTQVETPQSNHT